MPCGEGAQCALVGCTLTETELTFDPCCNKNLRRLSAIIFNFAAAGGLLASRTSSPSLKLAARTWRTSPGGRNSAQSLASASIWRALATIGRRVSSEAR